MNAECVVCGETDCAPPDCIPRGVELRRQVLELIGWKFRKTRPDQGYKYAEYSFIDPREPNLSVWFYTEEQMLEAAPHVECDIGDCQSTGLLRWYMERGVAINAKNPNAIVMENVGEVIGPSTGRNFANIICASILLGASSRVREGLGNRLARYAAEEELKRGRWYRGTVAVTDPHSERTTAIEVAAQVADGFARSESATQDERLIARAIARSIRLIADRPNNGVPL